MTVPDATALAAPGNAVSAAPAVRFIGERSAYWRLLIRGAVLLAFTLGIYRFWFATDVRRYLWSNTDVSGDTLEYSGTAFELLMGFLIAIALLIPLYVGLFLAALSLGEGGELISVLAFPLLFFLGQFAIYRARRYRLTRTVFRGIRCHQTGSALRYAVCAMFWWVMIVLTLGLAYPFAQSRLERSKMRHTYYGNLQGRFEGSGFSLFLRGFPMWLLVIGPLVFAIAYSVTSVDWNAVASAASGATSVEGFIGQLESKFPSIYVAAVLSIGAVAASIILAVTLFPVFQAMTLRWWLSGLRFGGLTVRSRLRASQIYGAYLRFLWYGLLFTFAAGLIGSIGFVAYGFALSHLGKTPGSEIAGAAGAVVFYVAVMLGFSTIYQGTVKLALWRCGAESAEFDGAGALDRVRAQGAPGSPVGEGLADALNVGSI
ncbi:MAG: DUF898 domain-containing protein [Alphaproteobacteria bacterium]|nr:DUF898 domain-containing protein [Alphaproteobacteria bacterium]